MSWGGGGFCRRTIFMGLAGALLLVGPLHGQEEQAQPVTEHFQFGSYGRIPIGTDLEGKQGRQIRLVAHPPRLLEGPYGEVDFTYRFDVQKTDTAFLTHLTLALGEQLFHYSGNFSADLAVRNMYLEAVDVFHPGLSAWVGSRMYRGADIYLLDFWPLDEQNTVGGGVSYRFGKTDLRLHAGVNRLEDRFQKETLAVPADTVGEREILLMDRQRGVLTLRAERLFDLREKLKMTGVIYAEGHSISSGLRRVDDFNEEKLPADSGYLLGAMASAWGFGPSSHLNLYARFASGLAAYDEMAVPIGVSRAKTTKGARELLFALSSNYEWREKLGVLVGTYLRNFKDADPTVYDRDDTWEVGFATRPAWFVTEHFQLIGELNFQYLRPNGLSLETSKHEQPLVFQLGLMPSLSLGKGSYARPQLRLLYAVSFLNEAAQNTYAPEDPLRGKSVRHYLGVGAEWWFHSSRYSD